VPKDYKNVTRTTKKSRGNKPAKTGSLLSFIAGLSLGLLVAVFIYFTDLEPFSKRNTHKEIVNQKELTTPKPAKKEKLKVAKTPEPQFDFYKILPRKEVNISEWVTEEQEQTEVNAEEPGIYVLQVGSFKKYEAADKIKAKLAMMGITADIQRVVINGQDIRHRVRIGPYKNKAELQVARDRLLSNDLDFMLLKLKMEDI